MSSDTILDDAVLSALKIHALIGNVYIQNGSLLGKLPGSGIFENIPPENILDFVRLKKANQFCDTLSVLAR